MGFFDKKTFKLKIIPKNGTTKNDFANQYHLTSGRENANWGYLTIESSDELSYLYGTLLPFGGNMKASFDYAEIHLKELGLECEIKVFQIQKHLDEL